jgi:hypothetical protein
MATVPSQIAAGTPRGISNVLKDFVVETESITDNDVSEQVPDQNGAIADEIKYDKRTDLRLTVRSANASVSTDPAAIGTLLQYPSSSGAKYKVDSVEEAGSYNGLRRWNITAHKYENFPAQS